MKRFISLVLISGLLCDPVSGVPRATRLPESRPRFGFCQRILQAQALAPGLGGARFQPSWIRSFLGAFLQLKAYRSRLSVSDPKGEGDALLLLAFSPAAFLMEMNHALPNLLAGSVALTAMVLGRARADSDPTVLSLAGGAALWTPLAKDRTRRVLERGFPTRLRRTPSGDLSEIEPIGWQYIQSPLGEVNQRLHMNLAEHIQSLARAHPEETVRILDWGCGKGATVIDLARQLKEAGITNVQFFGFSDEYHAMWNKAPETVTFIWDVADHLPGYFDQHPLHFIYSHFGIAHLGMEYYDHLKALVRRLSPDGTIRHNDSEIFSGMEIPPDGHELAIFPYYGPDRVLEVTPRQAPPAREPTEPSLDVIRQLLHKQEELMAPFPRLSPWESIFPGTRDHAPMSALYFIAQGVGQLRAVDESRRIRELVHQWPPNDPRRWAWWTDMYVERPAQRLVLALLERGLRPEYSNAYGPGLKGVWWTERGLLFGPYYFTPLREEDYDPMSKPFSRSGALERAA